MSAAETPRDPGPSPDDEPRFADDPADSARIHAGGGFRLHDSGELGPDSDLALLDASPEEPPPQAADVPAHDSGVLFLDASPDADDLDRFAPLTRAMPAPPAKQSNARAAAFFAEQAALPDLADAPAPAPAGYARCPACDAKNAAEAERCGRCAAVIPRAIPARCEAAAAPGMGIRITATREAPQAVDDDVLPAHARNTIQARREAQAAAREASQARYRGKRQGLMLRVALCFALLGLLPSAFMLPGWSWVLAVPLDLAIGALAARFLLDRDAHTVSGQLSFGAGSALSTLIKGGVGLVVDGIGLVFLFGAALSVLVVAVVVGGFVGHALEGAALDEA